MVPDTDDRRFKEEHLTLQKEFSVVKEKSDNLQNEQLSTQLLHDSLVETNTLVQTEIRDLEAS